MHSGATFSLKVVQWDRRRKENCGKLLVVESAELVWGDGGNDRTLKAERQPTPLEAALIGGLGAAKKRPDHQSNYTRNIRVLIGGMKTESILKIHPLLIVEFNGQKTTA